MGIIGQFVPVLKNGKTCDPRPTEDRKKTQEPHLPNKHSHSVLPVDSNKDPALCCVRFLFCDSGMPAMQ